MDKITHYIILLMRETGLQIDSDTYVELAEAQDEISELKERVRKLEEAVAWVQHSVNNN